jgi:tetratricopeptide (TPR) repeat protein
MSSSRTRLVGLTASLALTASLLVAQAQPGANAGRLVPANPRATAITEYEAALDAWQGWSWPEGYQHARRALAADSSFGLARALHARYRGGPTAGAEYVQAAADAARGPVPEALLALAIRSGGAAGPVMWNTAAQLFPNDPRVALDRALALAGPARLDALRETVKKFPAHVASKYWLAYYLAIPLQPRAPQALLDEALAVAQEGVRQAPNAGGSHTALAFVLQRLEREDEALEHLKAATSVPDPANYAFEVRAEILLHKNRIAEARAALDSAILLTDNMGGHNAYEVTRALTFMHEGNLASATAALEGAAREANETGQRGVEPGVHVTTAMVLAAANDLRGVDEQLAIARRLGSAPATLNDAMVISYGLTKQGAAARKALEAYIVTAQAQAPAVRDPNVHRMTGMALLAEGKPAEAIEEFKQGGTNPYAQVGIIEAYLQMGKKKEAAAERVALFARTDFVAGSTALAGARYRSLKK